MVEYWKLKQRQGLSLDEKIKLSKIRIRNFYKEMNGKVYVAFSGGKDSTVLLHLIRQVYPNVKGVFVDTGLEYPEVKSFVKTQHNIDIIKPEMSFKQVIKTYGYPCPSKKVAYQVRQIRHPRASNKATRHLYLTGEKSDGTMSKAFKLPKKWMPLIDAPFEVSEQCCNIMKKKPFHKYNKKTGTYPYIGVMASDSAARRATYLKNGCNIISGTHKQSNPLAFWTTKDIWEYIHKFNLPYAKIYDKGVTNTGCIFCMFGAHLDGEPNRFQCMKKSHPKLWNYCMYKLGIKEVLDYINVPTGEKEDKNLAKKK